MSTRRQLPGKISGTNPLIYTGSTPNVFIETRRPTTKDYIGYEIGTQWIIPKKAADAPASAPSQEFWFLVSKSNNMGIWKRLRGGGSPASTLSVNIRVFDTPGSGTYIPTEGMTECIVECQGGGSGASSASTDGASNSFAGYSGSSGGYCKRFFTAIEIGSSQGYVIGSAGIGGAAIAPIEWGTNGGDTAFGSFLTATGGIAGVARPDPDGILPEGGTATGGDININGQQGSYLLGGPTVGPTGIYSIAGSNSLLGLGGQAPAYYKFPTVYYDGYNATGYGAGGGPANVNGSTNTIRAGGNGSSGVIIITEFIE